MAKRRKAAARKSFAPVQPAPPKLDWLWALVLVAAVVATYLPVWWAGYIWDDDVILTANPVIIGPLGLKEIWTTNAADICPLTLTTFWFEHALWGPKPLPYHLVNIALHAVSAVMLWRILLALQIPGAWLGAAFWMLHPVQVESVAWVSELKNMQSTLFYLLAIFFFVRGLKGEGRWSMVLTWLFAALAMASKSATVVLPLVLLLCAWWIDRRWDWRRIIATAPIFAMSLATGLVSVWTQNPAGADAMQSAGSWPSRLVTAGHAVWFYAGKLIWPYPLMMIYPRHAYDPGHALSYFPLLLVILVSFALWWWRKSWSRPALFAWAYFLVTLLPVLGFFNMSFFRHSFVADHFQYLASMGPLALVGAGVESVSVGRKGLRWIAGAGLLAILAVTSWQRSSVYANEETLWVDNLAKNSHVLVAYNNLGLRFTHEGRLDEAMVQFHHALELKPDDAESYFNEGNVMLLQGQFDEAISLYQKALALKPTYADVYNDLGLLFDKKGNEEQAIAYYKKALELKPAFAEAHNDLGVVYFRQGKFDEGLAEFQEAVRLKPKYTEAQENLDKAQAYIAQKRAPK